MVSTSISGSARAALSCCTSRYGAIIPISDLGQWIWGEYFLFDHINLSPVYKSELQAIVAVPAKKGVARRRLHQTGQHFHRRALSCTVHAEQGKQLALLHRQIQRIHRRQRFIPFCQLLRPNGVQEPHLLSKIVLSVPQSNRSPHDPQTSYPISDTPWRSSMRSRGHRSRFPNA